jgi:hypothetical protein
MQYNPPFWKPVESCWVNCPITTHICYDHVKYEAPLLCLPKHITPADFNSGTPNNTVNTGVCPIYPQTDGCSINSLFFALAVLIITMQSITIAYMIHLSHRRLSTKTPILHKVLLYVLVKKAPPLKAPPFTNSDSKPYIFNRNHKRNSTSGQIPELSILFRRPPPPPQPSFCGIIE